MAQSSPVRTVLIIGGDSTIGRGLAGRLCAEPQFHVRQTTRRSDTANEQRLFLDLSQSPTAWPELPAADVAYFCAGVTRQSECRRNPIETWKVNVDHTQQLAQRLMAQGTFVVFISTNLVFDGTEPFVAVDCAVNPQMEYGRQKAAVEQELTKSDHAAVVRLGKVLPPHDLLLQSWRVQLASGETIYPFHDLRMAPLPLGFVVELLFQLGQHRAAGIVQATANQDVSYAETAVRLANRLGVSPELVQPVSAAATRPDLLPLPRHTTLAPFPDLKSWGLTIPNVWTTIDAAGGVGVETKIS